MGQERIKSDIEEYKIIVPERNLWTAVFIQAVREACSDNEKIANAAMKWLQEQKQAREVGGVLWVCDVTGNIYRKTILHILLYGTREEKQRLKKELT